LFCADELELIFRGGTGSVHSADSRRYNDLLPRREMIPQHCYSPPEQLQYTRIPFPREVPLQLTYHQPQLPQVTVEQIPQFCGTTECEEYDSQSLWTDFLQNKGDTINTSSTQAFDDIMLKDSGWTEFINTDNNNNNTNSAFPNNSEYPNASNSPRDDPRQNKRRFDSYEEVSKKRAKLSSEVPFQNMFFDCVHFLTLPQIAAISATASVPVFVKDSNSVFIYINPMFCSFINNMRAGVDVVANKTHVSHVVDETEASSVIDQDRWMMSQEQGHVKTFNTVVNKRVYQIVKEWVTLADGKTVIVGAVTST